MRKGGGGPCQLPILNQDLRISEDGPVLKTRPQPRADLVTLLRFQPPLVLISGLINFPTSSILFEEPPPQEDLHLMVLTTASIRPGISFWIQAFSGRLDDITLCDITLCDITLLIKRMLQHLRRTRVQAEMDPSGLREHKSPNASGVSNAMLRINADGGSWRKRLFSFARIAFPAPRLVSKKEMSRQS